MNELERSSTAKQILVGGSNTPKKAIKKKKEEKQGFIEDFIAETAGVKETKQIQ